MFKFFFVVFFYLKKGEQNQTRPTENKYAHEQPE